MAAFVDSVPVQSDPHLDLGPLVGRKRGFKTRERIPFSSGMAGMVMCKDNDNETTPRPVSSSSLTLNIKGKERATNGDGDTEMADTYNKSTGRVCETKGMSSFLFFSFSSEISFVRRPNY